MGARGMLVLLLLIVGCGPNAAPGTGDGPADGGATEPAPDARLPGVDARLPPGSSAVYAHSARTLFRIDPDSLEVTTVGDFGWSDGADSMTDIAIDADGRIVGVSFDAVYEVDPDTAAATRLAGLNGRFNGLSFVPAEQLGETGGDLLVGARGDGAIFRIDPATGNSSQVGAYGEGLSSSGDIVSVAGLGTFATVHDGEGADKLARLEPGTFAATIVGSTDESNIWGLGFWNDRVFGFTSLGRFVVLDLATGEATLIESSGGNFWGAGVTTSAPYVE